MEEIQIYAHLLHNYVKISFIAAVYYEQFVMLLIFLHGTLVQVGQLSTSLLGDVYGFHFFFLQYPKNARKKNIFLAKSQLISMTNFLFFNEVLETKLLHERVYFNTLLDARTITGTHTLFSPESLYQFLLLPAVCEYTYFLAQFSRLGIKISVIILSS